MTIEDAKKELREYRDNIKYIEEKQNDAEELRARIEKITPNLTGLPNAKGIDLDKAPLEESLDRIKEIEKDCNNKLQELLLKKYVVENKIEQLEQPFKSILYLRYIRGNTLNKVSNDIGYSYEYICRMHGKALQFYSEL
jgi:DNA-directed RNA polymerase specialized sigma subunit